MEKLALVLWRERELLETLLYRLEVEQLLLTNHRSDHLTRAANDVEAVLETIRQTEVLRAVAADEAAAALGLAPSPSLFDLAEASEEPWRSILLEHREAFTSTTNRLTDMAETNRDLLTAGWQAARAALADLEEPTTYAGDGRAVGSDRVARLFDGSL
ncbi:flagellar export chaperone FlgN [Nocardioides bruguierae]|uniref:Flagellar protein FlgN n=1 Tax=Nocardioides bruguierae TaxID=2945102 RepID=A0A9X2DAD2_9ACTN|nr:flagellar export chaperone FlgN [Nocardioides bruguierae]MCM0621994.1 flagellar protein FlgN [Nocardioides bruguierae]